MRRGGIGLESSCVLVTGATGFIGGHLVPRLVARGAMVVGTSRRAAWRQWPGVEFVQLDLADLDQVRRILGQVRPDAIFHLSSLADGKRELRLVAPVFKAEVVSTVNLLIAATEAGVRRLILARSMEEPFADEPPSSPYSAAKAASHGYARMFHSVFGLPVVSVRIFMAYGAGQPGWKFIPSVTENLLVGQAPHVAHPGRRLDWVNVSDVADGLVLSAEVEGLEGESVDLGSGQLISLGELASRLQRLCSPAPEPLCSSTGPEVNVRATSADVERTRRLIGWVPKVSLEEGLEATVSRIRTSMRGSRRANQ